MRIHGINLCTEDNLSLFVLWLLLLWRGVDLPAAESEMLQQLVMPPALQPHPQARETLSLLGFWDFGQYSNGLYDSAAQSL